MTTDEMHPRLKFYTQALTSFSSSSTKFQILQSLPSPPSPTTPPRQLYILDSSFNPPTLAHLRIILSALDPSSSSSPAKHPASSIITSNRGPSLPSSAVSPPTQRILLLLATRNADKAPQPAPFPQRLCMMELLAHAILSRTRCRVPVDIAVTTLPYFVDKSHAIAESATYRPQPQPSGSIAEGEAMGEGADMGGDASAGPRPEQIHLLGYDTLLRILDAKYYPPEQKLHSLVPFLQSHRLRVTYRADDGWGEKEEQDAFLRDIGEGSLDSLGGERRWVTDRRIELVEGRKEGEEAVSSTKTRNSVKEKDWAALKDLVTDDVLDWIKTEGLYS